MTVLCKDCRHSIQGGSNACWWYCDKSRRVSPVDGAETMETCGIVRTFPTTCGPKGAWFEPIAPAAIAPATEGGKNA